MANYEVRKFFNTLDDMNESEKEIFLKEEGEALRKYIKTGIQTSQLENLVDVKAAFSKKYVAQMDMENVLEAILKTNEEMVKVKTKRYLQKNEDNKKKLQEELLNYIISLIKENIDEYLKKVIKDIAYLSHVNMLYELYEKEEYFRREIEEYKRISENYENMDSIIRRLNNVRRVSFQDLQREENLSKEKLNKILNRNLKYFNIRKTKKEVQVSLSPNGRKYSRYLMSLQRTYSQKDLNDLIYKNCDKIMEAMDKTYDKKVICYLKLDGVSKSTNQTIQFKYNKISKKFLVENETIYETKSNILKKESEYNNNEKRITFPDGKEWVPEIRGIT